MPNPTFNNSQKLSAALLTRALSSADYRETYEQMLARTLERIALKKDGVRTPDELWLVDHNDVYTLGQAGKEEHILQRNNTPIIKTDRGGQVTWHGTGQLVVYWLFDLGSLGWSVRNLVSHAEQALEDVINDCLIHHPTFDSTTKIDARARRDAPGVYLYSDIAPSSVTTDSIMLGKVASLGFKIKHNFSYHGLALNIDCDLSAFNAINPCGYAGMQMLRLADVIAMNDTAINTAKNSAINYAQITQKLVNNIARRHAGLIDLRPISSK